MNLLLIADYIFSSPWRISAWAPQIGRALAARGHRVTIACDGARDPAGSLPCRVILRRPLRTWRNSAPISLARWAAGLARELPNDAMLSFVPMAPADAILPLGGAVASLRAITGGLNPVAAGLELLHQPWLPITAAMEAFLARRSRSVRLTIGPGVGAASTGIGYASRLEPLHDPSGARARVRAALGMGDRRPVLLMSSCHPGRPGLEPMLRALAETRAEARPALAPIALVVGRNGYSVHAAASRAGCPDGVRILGGTAQMAEVLAACDLVIAPGGALGQLTTGRLVADALRCGRPVLADRAAPGAAMLAAGPENGYTMPGLTIERRTAPAWREALATALEPAWLAEASRAAAGAGAGLSMDALAARIETVLEGGVSARREPVSRP